MPEENNIISEAEFILAEKELKDTINDNFEICCPKCHSKEYDIYPTGCGLINAETMRPEEDMHWYCLKCGVIFNSYFFGKRYGYKKSCHEGKICEKFKNE